MVVTSKKRITFFVIILIVHTCALCFSLIFIQNAQEAMEQLRSRPPQRKATSRSEDVFLEEAEALAKLRNCRPRQTRMRLTGDCPNNDTHPGAYYKAAGEDFAGTAAYVSFLHYSADDQRGGFFYAGGPEEGSGFLSLFEQQY